jgi:pectinesterase
LYEVNPAAHAAIWHDGSKDKDMKFVLRNCRFDGTNNWILARHHRDAQFYLLDCTFSKTMTNLAPYRVVYPIAGDKPSPADEKKNRDLDASNQWGERAYFFNCHRDGGDYAWFTNNLPVPAEQITAAWTFAGRWDPERRDGPTVKSVTIRDDKVEVVFSEDVTVKGKPQLKLKDGKVAGYVSGSGSNTLTFSTPGSGTGGLIIASEASATLRPAVADSASP